MGSLTEMKRLQARKQALLEESGINRSLLSLEWREFRRETVWLDRGWHWYRTWTPVARAAIPLAVLLLVRRGRWRSLWWKALAGGRLVGRAWNARQDLRRAVR